MKRPSRRTFLVATAASVGLAGCSGIEGEIGGSNGNGSGPTAGGGNATGTDGTPSGGGPTGDFHYTDRGEVLEDFEDISLWGTIKGEATTQTDAVYKGSRSARIQNPAGDAAGIYKSFPDGLDLTSHDLSIAAKLNSPSSGKIAMDVLAPTYSDHLVCRRYVPEQMDGWLRIDLGYTGKQGEPDLSNVQELRLVVLSDGEPIDFVVDDLRLVPKQADSGRVVLSFDDTLTSHYEKAFPELQKRGWPAMESAIPHDVNSDGYLTTGQLREMRDAGWDVISNPHNGTPLPQLSTDEKERAIKQAKHWLNLKGFRDGMRFMAIPYDAYDAETLDLVRKHHDMGFTFGACPNTIPPVGEAAVSRVYGKDLNGAARMINLAAQYNQLTVVAFEGIGPNKRVSMDHFTHLLDIIEGWGDNLQVTTPSQLQAMAEQV